MTATAEPPAPTVEAPAQTEAPTHLPLDRGEGVELLGDIHGCGYRDGACLVRRRDGQMVQLGPLMYALLESINGQRDTHALTKELSERLGRRVKEEHVLALAQKLAAQGLLAGFEEKAPPRSNPLLALRWKVLVTNPKLTRRLTAPFTFLFRPWVMVPMLLCFLGVCWFVLFHKGVASATSQAFQSPELLLVARHAHLVCRAVLREQRQRIAARLLRGRQRETRVAVAIRLQFLLFELDRKKSRITQFAVVVHRTVKTAGSDGSGCRSARSGGHAGGTADDYNMIL